MSPQKNNSTCASIRLLGLALSLCLSLSACSVLRDEQSAPAASKNSPSEANCSLDDEHWQISGTAQKMTVRHRYQNSLEHCEKKKENRGEQNMMAATKGSSLHSLLKGEVIAAAVDVELDPPQTSSDKTKMHFSAI